MNQSLIKKLIYITFTIELIISSSCFCSFENQDIGAQFQAMGKTSVAFVNTPDAIFLNCSGLVQANGYQFSFYYTNPYGIKDLSHGTFSCSVPFHWFTIGLGVRTFGNTLYRENEIIASFARKMHEKFYYGLSCHYMRLAISSYGTNSTFGLDMSFITVLSSRLKWGFFIHNLNKPRISSRQEALPQIFSTGFSLNPVENLAINFDFYKDVRFPTELRFGFEYILVHRLALRGGFTSDPAQFTAGFGVIFSFINMDYAFSTHSDLGITHHFSLNFALKRKTATQKETLNETVQITFQKVNINEATAEQLQQINGIGPVLAKRIIEYRIKCGGFVDIDELKNVKSIGEKLFQKIKPYITIE